MIMALIFGMLIPFISVITYFIGLETLFYVLGSLTLLGSLFLMFASGDVSASLLYLMVSGCVIFLTYTLMQPSSLVKPILLGSSISACFAIIFYLKNANFSCGGN